MLDVLIYVIAFTTNTDGELTCGTNQYKCEEESKCISKHHVCDSISHCASGSDERQCTPFYGCYKILEKFHCKDRLRCIDNRKKCDRRYDCLDGSDEVNCGPCYGFRCKSGKRECLSTLQQCNGRKECQDGSDEKDCVCFNKFRCGTTEHGTKCLSRSYVCNGFKNCEDGSDEENCLASSIGQPIIKIPTIVALVCAMMIVVIILSVCRRRCRYLRERQELTNVMRDLTRRASLRRSRNMSVRFSTNQAGSTENNEPLPNSDDQHSLTTRQPPSYNEVGPKPTDDELPPYMPPDEPATTSEQSTSCRHPAPPPPPGRPLSELRSDPVVELVEADGSITFVSLPAEPPPSYHIATDGRSAR